METDKDLVIIGGGAAGLSAAQYGSRANLKTLVIEELAAGGQALLISDLENYPGFPETINGMDFSQKMESQAKNFGTEFLNAKVTKLTKKDNAFILETGRGTITAKAVILATGAKHRTLDIPGEKELSGRGVSYCATCDGPFFKGKKMLVVGGGDAACDESSFLAKLTDKVIHIHRKDRFRAQKSLAERVLANPHIEVRFHTIVKEIKGENKVEKVVLYDLKEDREYEEELDAVFVFIGSIPQTQIVEQIKKDEGGYIETDQHMETSIKGLFAAGDVRATPFRQLVVAAGEGAVASHAAAHHIDAIQGELYV